MKILAISDVELGQLYQPSVVKRFQDVDIIVSCGDLPHYYLEYLVSMLNIPLYYVNGNHTNKVEITTYGEKYYPWGAINLHRRCLTDDTGLLIAGIQGSLRYNNGAFQYTQQEMWLLVFNLATKFMINKIRYNRFLDIFVSHAPPWKIHDDEDLPHQGIKAFRWLIRVFKPVYHLHGHTHIYRNDSKFMTALQGTKIVNCYGYRELNFDMKNVIAGLKKNLP
jgi:Icc-related predicted phosphoesterase